MGVDAGADGGAAKGYLRQLRFRVFQSSQGTLDLASVAAELLAEADGRGVLQVRPAGLDDGPEFLRLGLQRGMELSQSGGKVLFDRCQRSDVNGRGDDVVGGLAHVDVVVGVDEAVATVAAEQLRGAVRDDLVGVGVGGRAGTGLEDVQHKVFVERAVDHFIRRRHDGAAKGAVEQAQLDVGLGGSLLDEGQGANEAPWKTEVADGKVEDCAHG